MNADKLKWFKDARFGMFIHWGLYALPGGIWKGQEMEYIGEWLQARFRIPNSEYSRLAAEFNPVGFNAEEWVLTAKAAGMRYIVYTAKHHEGFAMYHSKVSDFNIHDATPFKRDPLAELAQACEKHGIRLGLYYSQDLDWHEPDGGDPGPSCGKNAGMMSWGNDWDFPNVEEKKFSRYFEGKVLPQLTELLTNYGKIATLWFDCPVSIKKPDSERIVALVRKLQPDCLINTRIGNGLGDYGSLGDNQVPSARLAMASESPGTLNDTWGFKVNDHNWKPAKEVLELIASLAAKDANYLLNIGPQPDGKFPEKAVAILQETGRWMERYGSAIYRTSGNPFPYDFDWGFMTVGQADGSTRTQINFLLRKTSAKEFTLSGIDEKIKRCHTVSKPERELPFSVEERCGIKTLRIEIGSLRFCNSIEVIAAELETAEKPKVDQRLIPQAGRLRLLASAGNLQHGRTEAAMAKGEVRGVGAAGETHCASKHSFLDAAGKLVEWQNPSDSISWTAFFPEGGDYALEFATSSRGHNAPWTDGQIVKIDFKDQYGSQSLKSTLKGDVVEAAGSRCYKEGLSSAGTLTVRAGAKGVLSISMLELGNPKNVNMALNEIRLAAH